MTSKTILPKRDLAMLAHAHVGDWVETQKYGEAKVTKLMKNRAMFALRHWNND